MNTPEESGAPQTNRPAPDFHRLVAGVLAILLLGGLFTALIIRRVDRRMRDDLLGQAYAMAQAIPLDRIQALNGNSSDAQKPEYRRLSDQLATAVQIDPAWQRIVLLGRRPSGEIFIRVDSVEDDEPDSLPPGQPCPYSPRLFQRVFTDRTAVTEGPRPSRRDACISAFVPLADPKTGEIISVLVIDSEAGRWRAEALAAGLVPGLVTLLLIAFLLTGYVSRRQTRRIQARNRRRWRNMEVTLTIATGLCLTYAGVWLAGTVENIHYKETFQSLVRIKTEMVRHAFRTIRSFQIESLTRYFENSEEVTREEFRGYAESLGHTPEVWGWGWIPAGPASAEPEQTYPLRYLYSNQTGMLLADQVQPDLARDPDLRARLNQAAWSGLPVATDLRPFLTNQKINHHILIFRPVRNQEDPAALQGFVLAVLNPARLLNIVLQTDEGRRPHLHLEVLELHQDRAAERLAGNRSPGTARKPIHPRIDADYLIHPVLAFGKTYAVAAVPTPAFYALHATYLSWIVLLAGLALTAAVTIVMAFFTHRREDMERQVEERTLDLATSMRRYDLLARQSRVIVWQTDAEGRYTDVNVESENITGYAREELIGRKHIFDLHPREGREEIRWFFLDNLTRGEAFSNVTHAVVTRSGETVWFLTSGIPLQDTEGRPCGCWGTSTNITERKHAEDQMARLAEENKQAAERYSALIRASNTGAWEYHDDTAYMWTSPEYFAMLGRDPADYNLKPGQANMQEIWLDLVHPDDRDRVLQDFVEYMKNPAGTYEHTFRMSHADGHWVWILSRGQLLRDAEGKFTSILVGAHTDISETKRVEHEYRTLFRTMLEGFAVHEIICDDQGRPVDYRFLALNPAFERMTGLKAKDIVGKTVLEVLPGIDRKWIDIYGQVALSGTALSFENYSAAQERYFEVTAFRPGPNQFACISSDITEQKRSEHELRESRRRYIALLANLPGMAYRCKNDRRWTMEFVSWGCEDLTGYTPKELVGDAAISFRDIIVPADRETVWEEWQKALREHRCYEGEYQITTRSGETIWVWERGDAVHNSKGEFVGLEGFIADITDRKRASFERERLMAAIEQSREIILITDEDGIMQYVNPAFTESTGYFREEALGKNPRILKSGKQSAEFYENMWKTLLAGRIWEGQLINRRKDGGLYTERASISPVRNPAGRIVNFVAVKRDITQQLRDEKERENLQAQLLQAQKMESIGRLAGGVAHDFNNMLQAILGYTEMALEQVPEDQPLHGDLTEIHKAAQRSASLTRQLQTFARKQDVTPQPIDLNAAIENMSRMLRPLIGEDVTLEWKPGSLLGRVKVDPGQLDQLVTNLCINARDAITPPGKIVIETRNASLDHPFHSLHGDIKPGDYIVLSVTDDGCGMGDEVLPHIFEPFFTTKSAGKGTGLGLAMVYGIVQQNGGVLQVLSRPGQGSTFQVFLPRDDGKTEKQSGTVEPSPQETGGNETILIVEDEKTLLQAASRMLTSMGYRVVATQSSREALRIMEERGDDIHLLLTDVIMPDLNGPALVQTLLKNRPGLKHLYMSGYTANLMAKEGVPNNSTNFLQKPFSRGSLARKVRDVLDG